MTWLNVGKDVGELAEVGYKLGVAISNDAAAVLNSTKPDAVIHATGSSLKAVFPQLKQIIELGYNIVSTCEELSFPFRQQPELAQEIDALAKAYHVTVTGTGVNPGFLMDAWPLFMTAVCENVTYVKAARIQDASSRRIPFQKKIGAGRTIEEFNELVKAGTLRHVGLAESIGMIADGLGWKLDEITETIEPIIAEKEVKSNYITVKPGQAAGVKQTGHGWQGGKELIFLNFEASVGAEESYDAVYIKGKPDMEVVIKGGVGGDIATTSIAVNAVPRVIEAQPGLKSMKDIGIVSSLPII